MRKTLITPILDLKTFVAAKKGYPQPLNDGDVFFFGYARTALMCGLKALGIQKGDTVLLPSYICNVMLAPLNYLGINAEYYGVRRDMSPDMDDLSSKTGKGVKAVMAVNYFGFPTKHDEIKQFCRTKKIFYIEDNAHGYLSCSKDRPLGSFGDISIFSIRKTLPVPNGAALKLNNPSIPSDISPVLNNDRGEVKYLFGQVRAAFENLSGISPVKIVKMIIGRKESYEPMDEGIEEEKDLDKYLIKQSAVSQAIAKRSNYDEIKRNRRKMFLALIKEIKSAEPVFKELPDGVVPYAFPVYSKDVKGFIKEMYDKGACCCPWPTLPSNLTKYPDFYKQVVLVPVWRKYGN
ncbi:MAG: DegT/DnrJ/EryC1/StrS family aminotransferase [Candidatus Margulisiibacteriota bacterium]